MDEYHRRDESGRYDHETSQQTKPNAMTRLRELLVPGSGKGVVVPQNEQEKRRLKELEDL